MSSSIIGIIEPDLPASPHLSVTVRLGAGLRLRGSRFDVMSVLDFRYLPLEQIAGVVCISPSEKGNIGELVKRGLPVVVVNKEEPLASHVSIDYQPGTQKAFKHLFELGRQRIAFARGNTRKISFNERYNSYLSVLDKLGFEADPDLIFDVGNDYRDAFMRISDLQLSDLKFDAIVCVSDRMAIGCSHALIKKGIRVPEDVAVIGFGNQPAIQEQSGYSISSISVPYYNIGYEAADLIVDQIDQRDEKIRSRVVAAGFVERDSSVIIPRNYPRFLRSYRTDISVLDHALSIDRSLSEASIESLKAEFAAKCEDGCDAFKAFQSTMLKASIEGLNNRFVNSLVISVGKRLGAWNRLQRKPVNADSLLASVYDACDEEFFQSNQTFRINRKNIETVIDPSGKTDDGQSSLEAFLPSLEKLGRYIEMNFLLLIIFNEPSTRADRIESGATAWKYNGRDIKQVDLAVENGSIDYKKTFPQRNDPHVLLCSPLVAEEGILGLLLHDMDTPQESELRRALPSLARRLQRLRLIESLKEKQEDLAEQKSLAEKASAAKSDFLASMSHEIRTPLNCVLGMAEVLLATNLSVEQVEYMEMVKKGGTDLLSIINDILDFSKLQSGKAELYVGEFSLHETFDHIHRLLRQSTRDKGLQFNLSLDDAVPQKLIGDSRRLQQILVNLIGNAIKFTSEGGIFIDASLKTDSQSNVELLFKVTDTGVGIPSDKTEGVFSQFEQLQGASSDLTQGTGLGLAICRELVSMMKGRIWVESELGKGSVFMFTACFDVPPEMVKAKSQDALKRSCEGRNGNGSKRVLLVDDIESNVLVAKAMLELDGHDVMVARDGLAAVESWRSNEFDIVLMDVKMPRMNGFEATRRIRELEMGQRTKQPISIIGLTAHAVYGYEDLCRDAGMNGYITKPVSRDTLQRILEQEAQL